MINRKTTLFRTGALLTTLLLFATASIYAQTKGANSSTATFTVTAVGKKQEAPPISKDDVQLFEGKERKQIADWKKGEDLFLAILIDDSIETTAGSQWDYLKQFIVSQPPTTAVALGYIRNNTVQIAQDFTPNHELVAKAVRLPIGISALGSSPYLATIDLLKRWPQTGPRRSIILITSGIDYFRGPSFGPVYPDVDPLIERAQRQNTNVWSIYYPSSGHRGHSFFLVNNAQINLDKVAESTGAESYYLGFGQPVTIQPYLQEISEHLNNQYLLTFAASGGSKGKFQSMKVRTELPDVEFMTPSSVFIPPGS
jgi:hypothetical protein